jgi:orotidine-5'-phosphate decarboxylase
MEAGCHGIVCSGREAKEVRRQLGPKPVIVTPGIRPAWTLVTGDDQRRVVTPAMAVSAGADYIVVGRPIRDAADPVKAAEKVSQEIASVIHK